jgi:hypothetical protein
MLPPQLAGVAEELLRAGEMEDRSSLRSISCEAGKDGGVKDQCGTIRNETDLWNGSIS